jgi:hypothetical protein
LSKFNVMFNKYLFFILLFSNLTQAQETIQTDRPDQTETPAIVPKNKLQIETGFSYEKENTDISSSNLPTILIKYGVNDVLEIRVITGFEKQKDKNTRQSGFPLTLIGFKTKLVEEKGIQPKTSFIAHIGLPNVASTPFKTNTIAPQFRFTMQHTLTKKVSLGYNFGAEWDGILPSPTYLYTISSGFAISEKMGSYIEMFGFAPEDQKAYHSLDGGFTYLITNNFMLDLSSGIGITKNAPKYYLSFGFSFRI